MNTSSIFVRKPIAVVVSALCSSIAFCSHAQTTNADETVQVWGTQISSETSLLSNDIETKQADHLSDLLRDQPGVDVGGTHSLNQGINIRGLSELDLDITIDGASQTNNVFHHVGNLLINPDILQAVDIQVGNNSVLNNGIGGGVAFETKSAKDLLKPGETTGARVYTGIATNDYYQYSGTFYSQLTDDVDALVYYSALDRSNPVDGDGNEMTGEDGKTENVLVKFGWDANDSNRFVVAYDYYTDAGDYSLKSNMGDDYDHSAMIRPIEYTRNTVTLNHELYLNNTDVRTSAYYNEMSYENTDPASNEVGEGNNAVYGFQSLAETSISLFGMDHTLRYGGEGKSEESKKVSAGQVSGKETADSFAVYVEDEIMLLEGWTVTPGVRYHHHKVDMKASDDTFTDTTFGLATQYEVNQEWTVRASATQLFKGPALSGSYLASGSANNPDLKAETGVNYEAGIAYQTSDVMKLDRFGFAFTAFQTEINNYIDDVMTGKAGVGGMNCKDRQGNAALCNGPYRNLGDVEIKGFEAVMTAAVSNWDARLTYARSDSEFTKVNHNSNYADNNYVVGQSLDDEVGDSISFNLGYTLPQQGLSLNWTTQYVFDLDKDVPEDTFKEGYDVHGIGLSWTPVSEPDFTLNAGIDNLFNEQYASHASHDLGYTDYEPGRNYKLSASYAF